MTEVADELTALRTQVSELRADLEVAQAEVLTERAWRQNVECHLGECRALLKDPNV